MKNLRPEKLKSADKEAIWHLKKGDNRGFYSV
jgi:hypothetical protein